MHASRKDTIHYSYYLGHLILAYDFDARATNLKTEIQEDWEEHIKEQWKSNQESIKEGLIAEYGVIRAF